MNKLDYINESAIGGHIKHIYEDTVLTFGDVKNILHLISIGKIENSSEKIDGQNIYFSWDVPKKQLKIVRNKTDIKNGGLGAKDLANRFSQYDQNVSSTFINGYNVLSKGLSMLTDSDLIQIFGQNKETWISAEIVYNKNPNIIDYGTNAIVFHKNGINLTDDKFNSLVHNLQFMDAGIRNSNWKILPPLSIKFEKGNDNKIYFEETVNKINNIENLYGLNDQNTIQNFLENRIRNDVLTEIEENLPQNVKDLLVNKLSGTNQVDLRTFQNLVPANIWSIVHPLIKNKEKVRNESLKPIQELIHQFANGILKNVESSLIVDEKISKDKIKNSLLKSIELIKQNPDNNLYLNNQLKKIQSLENISTVEGVVFSYKGKQYKLIGSFSPLNSIINFFKY